MFEAVLTLTATVVVSENTQIAFYIYEGEVPKRDFLLTLAMTYYQEVYRLLQEGDTLTVTIHAPEVTRKIATSFREGLGGCVFDEAGHAQTPDLFPRIEKMYHEIFGLLHSGSTLSTIFQIKRL
jgi:hypothetical protein